VFRFEFVLSGAGGTGASFVVHGWLFSERRPGLRGRAFEGCTCEVVVQRALTSFVRPLHSFFRSNTSSCEFTIAKRGSERTCTKGQKKYKLYLWDVRHAEEFRAGRTCPVRAFIRH
jgi:hypothetical protein